MIMTIFDMLMSAYQGSLVIYTLKKQFVQRPHSFLYEVLSVVLIVAYLAMIQYLHLPISDFFSF